MTPTENPKETAPQPHAQYQPGQPSAQQHAGNPRDIRGGQRGAGSGERAVATRDRNPNEWPPEPIPHREHVDLLNREAQAQEDFNNDMNELQVEKNARFIENSEVVNPPNALQPNLSDEKREEARDLNLGTIFRDPTDGREGLQGEMDARAERDRKQAEEQGQPEVEHKARNLEKEQKERDKEREKRDKERDKDEKDDKDKKPAK